MVVVSVICGGAKEKKLWSKRLKKDCTEGEKIRICQALTLNAVHVPFDAEELKKKSVRKISRILDSAVTRAERGGDGVVFSAALCGIVLRHERLNTRFGKYISHDRSFMYPLLPVILKEVAAKSNIELMRSKVCICERRAGRISESVMKELCFDVRDLTLFTADIRAGTEICDRFESETGLFVRTADIDERSPYGADLVIDIDRAQIRFGRDIVVDKVDLCLKEAGFRVRDEDLFGYIAPSDRLELVKDLFGANAK